MFEPGFIFILIARLCARRPSAASRRAHPIGDTMLTAIATMQPPLRRLYGRIAAALITFLLPTILAFVPLVSFTTTAARACACGCSVFDVGGTGLPQENDHGGRVFFEFWSSDQTKNWVGTSKRSSIHQSGQETQYTVVQRRFPIHVQPAVGRHSAGALYQPQFDDRYRSVRR